MINIEIWKLIEGHKDYLVSNRGRIWSFKRKSPFGKILKPFPTPKGYLLIDLDNITYTTHRIVLKAFSPVKRNEDLQVNHKNMDKKDNRLHNLEWVTNRENIIHGWKNGRISKKGQECAQSKLTNDQVYEIKRMTGLNHREIAEKFNVTSAAIQKIYSNKNWRHIPWP